MKHSKIFLLVLSLALLSGTTWAGPGKPGGAPADKGKPAVKVYGPEDMLPYSPLEKPEATPEVEASPSPSPIPSPSPSVVPVVGSDTDTDAPPLAPIPQAPSSGTGNSNPLPIAGGTLGGAGGCALAPGAAGGVGWMILGFAAALRSLKLNRRSS